MKMAKNVGVLLTKTGGYIVEVEEFNSNPIDGVKQSLEFLQNAEFVKW